MLDRFRVLRAMSEYGERDFTVRELAERSGVFIGTVRTCVAREQHLLEETGREKTGKRGGQYARYRVKPAKLDELRSSISSWYSQLGVAAPLAEKRIGLEVPIGLQVARDTLERLYARAESSAEKHHLLEMVRIDLKGAHDEIGRLRHRGVDPLPLAALDMFCAVLEHQAKTPDSLDSDLLKRTAENCELVVERASGQTEAPVVVDPYSPGEKEPILLVAAAGAVSPPASAGEGTSAVAHVEEPPKPASAEDLMNFKLKEIRRLDSPEEQEVEAQRAANEFVKMYPDCSISVDLGRCNNRARIAHELATQTHVFLKPHDLAEFGDDPVVYLSGVLSPMKRPVRLGERDDPVQDKAYVLNVREYRLKITQRASNDWLNPSLTGRYMLPGRVGMAALADAFEISRVADGARLFSMAMGSA